MRRIITLISFALLAVTNAGLTQGGTAWIVVNDPAEWSDEQMLTVPRHARIKVAGQAYHPQGIEKITVGGERAALKRNAAGIVDFEAVLAAGADMAQVSVIATGVGGEPLIKNFRLTVTGNPDMLDPGGAAIRSILPGLGQLYTGQTKLGIAFMGATALAIGVGVGIKELRVKCNVEPIGGVCPNGQVANTYDHRPYLVPALVAVVGLGVGAGIQASSFAKKKNTTRGEVDASGWPKLGMTSDRGAVGVSVEWRF